MRAILGKLSLAVASVLITLTLVEVAARVLLPTGSLQQPYRAWVVRDPVMGWKNEPGLRHPAFRHNTLGFRGEEIQRPKPEGKLRIACLGDSGTYGLWLEENPGDPNQGIQHFDSYPSELAERLRADPRIEVVNAGVIGYSSSHGLRQLIVEILDLEPDIVTARFGLNDHKIAFDTARLCHEPRTTLMRWLLYRFHDWQLARLSLRGVQSLDFLHPKRLSVRLVSPGLFERNLRRMADVARKRNIRLLFIDYPLRPVAWGEYRHDYAVYRPAGYKSLKEMHVTHERYQAILRRVAEEEQIPLLDTRVRFQSREEPVYTDWDFVHPNSVGTRELARLLHERFVALGWIEPTTPGTARRGPHPPRSTLESPS